MPEKNDSGFILFGEWIKGSWKKGRGCASLWVYLLVGIIICGGAGFWLLALQVRLNLCQPDLLMTFCSFAPAIACASCMDFILGENERKYLRAFAIFFAALILVSTFIAFFRKNYFFAVIATVLSLVVWWFANAENPRLSDVVIHNESASGDAKTKGVSGNLGGLQS